MLKASSKVFCTLVRLVIAFVVCVAVPPLAASGPRVISITPPAQSFAATIAPEIIVRFDISLDPTSVNSQTVGIMGRWAGICPGDFILEDDNKLLRFVPAKPFSAGEWISVSLSKGIMNSNGEAMSSGFAWNFWTAAGTGSLNLTEVARLNVRQFGENRQIRTYGAYAGDLDGDGFHDFTVPNEDADDLRVFMNDGSGGYRDFTIHQLNPGSRPSTNEGADFNRDGILDFAVGNILGGTASVLMGDGRGGFQPQVTYATANGTRGLGVLDLNGDGAMDIVTANRAASNFSILMNRGDGTFADAQNHEFGGRAETSIAVADANNDGLMDVFMGHYDSDDVAVLLGDGDGNLSLASRVSCRGDAWMIAAGDVDGDGNVDVVTANARQDQFAVLRGDGQGGLLAAEVYGTGRLPLAIDLGDLDGDGDLDLVTSNYFSANFRIFENDGKGRFGNSRTLLASTAGSCAVLHDRDRDGDLDMTGIDEEDDLLFLFENPGKPSTVDDSIVLTGAPATFELAFSYPNPVTATVGATRLHVPILLHRQSRLKVDLINSAGQIVAILFDSRLNAGQHRLPLDLPNQSLPAGVYFYRVQAEGQTAASKLLLMW